MTIRHHPTDTTLAAFAAGTLDEARGVVVATHVSLCARCRNVVRGFEAIGGAQLDGADPAAIDAGAFERAWAAIGSSARKDARQVLRPIDLPVTLAPYDAGPWRKIGRGVQWRSIGVPSGDGIRVFMLRAAPGTQLPHHKHEGVEWTCVLEGAFRHDLGRYGPGDFDEADESVEHKPFVEDEGMCVCLVALQGNIELQSWIGRLVQPFIRL